MFFEDCRAAEAKAKRCARKLKMKNDTACSQTKPTLKT